jgi:hypothetical protein
VAILRSSHILDDLGLMRAILPQQLQATTLMA